MPNQPPFSGLRRARLEQKPLHALRAGFLPQRSVFRPTCFFIFNPPWPPTLTPNPSLFFFVDREPKNPMRAEAFFFPSFILFFRFEHPFFSSENVCACACVRVCLAAWAATAPRPSQTRQPCVCFFFFMGPATPSRSPNIPFPRSPNTPTPPFLRWPIPARAPTPGYSRRCFSSAFFFFLLADFFNPAFHTTVGDEKSAYPPFPFFFRNSLNRFFGGA